MLAFRTVTYCTENEETPDLAHRHIRRFACSDGPGDVHRTLTNQGLHRLERRLPLGIGDRRIRPSEEQQLDQFRVATHERCNQGRISGVGLYEIGIRSGFQKQPDMALVALERRPAEAVLCMRVVKPS